MAISYGFFNSLNGDRTYNADDMSTYFKGLISDGVYENVGGALQVMAASGMNVNVQTGRAIINSKWLENDAVLSLPITAAHVTLNRYTAVVIHLDLTARTISIITKDGANATNPTKPAMTNGATVKEMCLAYVYVKAGATSISQANITDTRPNNNVCGWITGLVDQVDTSTLFNQWQTAYQNYYNQMTTAFNNWFDTLTSELTVDTYIQEYTKVVTIGSSSSKIVPLNMSGYTYESSDIFIIALNGLVASENYDYYLDTSQTPVEVHLNLTNATNELVDIRVLKSKIGFRQLADNSGNAVVTDGNENVII